MFYSVFARFDSAYTCDGDSYSESGRAVYVTESLDDANETWARWNDDTADFDPDNYWVVRRGCVDSYPTLSDVYQSRAVAAAEEFDCSPGAEPPAWWSGGTYGPRPATGFRW